MAQQREEREGPDPATIFVLITIVFVIVAMIGFAALFLIGRVNTSTSTDSGNIPYAINERPLPTVNRAVDLLFEQLGPFKRGPVTGTIQNYSATYTNGNNDKIDISGSQEVSFRAAQNDVAMVERNNKLTSVIQRQLNQDPSFIQTGGSGPVYLAWSHERWYFYIKASSQAALDAFMKVFRY